MNRITTVQGYVPYFCVMGLAALQDPGPGAHSGRVQGGIIQDINRHAAVVMDGLPADQAQQHTAEEVAQAVCLAQQVLLGPFSLLPSCFLMTCRNICCRQLGCLIIVPVHASCIAYPALSAVPKQFLMIPNSRSADRQ